MPPGYVPPRGANGGTGGQAVDDATSSAIIVIPEGAKPGMTIIVTTPQSKEQVQMVVPEGALPGARCVTRLPTRVRVACDRTGLLGGPAGTSSSSSGS